MGTNKKSWHRLTGSCIKLLVIAFLRINVVIDENVNVIGMICQVIHVNNPARKAGKSLEISVRHLVTVHDQKIDVSRGKEGAKSATLGFHVLIRRPKDKGFISSFLDPALHFIIREDKNAFFAIGNKGICHGKTPHDVAVTYIFISVCAKYDHNVL